MTGEEYPVGATLKFIGELVDDVRVAPPVWAAAEHPLELGLVGTVEAYVPAEVDGAGTKEDDCYVLSFPSDDSMGVRHISFEESQLAAWFEPVEEVA